MESRGFLLSQTVESVNSSLTSSRIKLTCVDSSRQYILLGANTGSIYVFERESCKFIQLLSIDAVREPVALLRFSPDEKYLALVTNKNRAIYIMEFALKIRRTDKDILKVAPHKADITHLLWAGSHDDLVLYSADDSGAVFKTTVGGRKSLFSAGPESDLLYQCDSRVVQMTYDEELSQILLSSMTKSVMIDFKRTQAMQVGTKPRDGPFGASHFKPFHAQVKEILLARPGKRIWCADVDTARVKQTINYQPSFESTSPTRLFDFIQHPASSPDAAAVNFSRLVPFAEVVLSISDRALVLIDADTNKILQWHNDVGNIVDVAIHEPTRSAYALINSSSESHPASASVQSPQRVMQLTFNLDEFFRAIVLEKQFDRAVAIVKKYNMSNLEMLRGLLSEMDGSSPPQEVDENVRSSLLHHIQDVQMRAAEEAHRLQFERASSEPITMTQDLGDSVLDLSGSFPHGDSCHPPASSPIAIVNHHQTSSSPSQLSLSRQWSQNNTPIAVSPVSDIAMSSPDDAASPSPSPSPMSQLPTPVGMIPPDMLSPEPSSSMLDAMAALSQQLEQQQHEQEHRHTEPTPALTGSFLKAEEPAQPQPGAQSNPIAAPVAKKAALKKKKPRLAAIAPPTPDHRAPSPIMLEIQQRSLSASSLPSSQAGTPAATPPPTSATPPLLPKTAAIGEESGPIDAARLPMVIQSALTSSNPLSAAPVKAAGLADSLGSSPSSTFSSTPPSPPHAGSRSTTPPPSQGGSAEPSGPFAVLQAHAPSTAAAAAAADKAFGEIKSMAKKVFDLPSMFSRASSAPVSTVVSPSMKHRPHHEHSSSIDSTDSITKVATSKLASFREQLRSSPITLTSDNTEKSQRAQMRELFDDQLRAIIQQWIDSFAPAISSETTDVSGLRYPVGSELAIRDLVSCCFEFFVDCSSAPASRLRFWTENDGLTFIRKYGRHMALSDSLFVANAFQWMNCVESLLELDDEEFRSRERQIFNPRFRAREQIEMLLSSGHDSQGNHVGPTAATQALNKLFSKSSGDLSLLLRFLPRLVALVPQQTIQFAASAYPAVRPHNVESILEQLQLQHNYALKVEYYSRLMKKHSECHSNSALVTQWIEACLSDEKPSEEELFTEDHKPMRNSHLVKWRHEQTIRRILESDSTSPSLALGHEAFVLDFEKLLDLFQTAGFWWGALHCLKRLNRATEAAKLAIQLDDVATFDSLLINPDADFIAFSRYLEMLLDRDCHCPTETFRISAAKFMERCIGCLGSGQTLALLNSPVVQSDETRKELLMNQLQPQMFQQLLWAGINQQSQPAILRDTLEVIDSYLWSMRSPMISAPFRSLEHAEAQEQRLHDNNLGSLPYVTSQPTFDGRMEYSINFTHRTPVKRAYGALSSHWGVRTNLRMRDCPRCDIQLTETVVYGSNTANSNRIIVFEGCGHAFHEACVDEDYCPICVRERVTSLLA